MDERQTKQEKGISLRGWRTTICALVLGAVLAPGSVPAGSNLPAVLILLLRPWTLLGGTLRAWSLSGTWGNAGAWAVIILLSALPTLFILISRLISKPISKQKHRQSFYQSFQWIDCLFPITSVGIFICLYLLINPALLSAPLPAAAADASLTQLWELIPALTLLSLLTACGLVRWADRLDQDRPLDKLLRAMRLLLKCIMALTAASVGYALTQSIQSIPLSAPQVYTPSPVFYETADPSAAAWAQLLLTVLAQLPDLFLIATLECASRLCDAFGKSGFQSRTEQCARDLALRAKRALIAAVLCMAGRNAAVMLFSRVLTDLSVMLTLPLGEMTFSCGAMLLAHCISAACRIQHENDLMI